MPSFRKANSQAKHITKTSNAIGKGRYGNSDEFRMHSIGTIRNYEQSLTLLADWLKEKKLGNLNTLTIDIGIQYLNARKLAVKQSTLDRDRQAIQVCLKEALPVIKSERITKLSCRTYTTYQIEAVAQAQTMTNGLATRIAASAGLRAHELLTLRSAENGSASGHRQWSIERFRGLSGKRYLVTGKGGLVREVLIPLELHTVLERLKLSEPEAVTDRSVHYERHYAIGGGQSWSNSFTRASKRALGWSRGAHGLRHTYAQQRLSTLQNRGYLYDDALTIVSQEMGHFRGDITEVYLR